MIDPTQMIISTEAFDTLKNDDYKTIDVTLPGSVSVPAGTLVTYGETLTIGQDGSVADVRFTTTKASAFDYLINNSLAFTRTGSEGIYNVSATAFHLSVTTIRCEVSIFNPYFVDMTSEAGDEVFTFKVRTYLPSFST